MPKKLLMLRLNRPGKIKDASVGKSLKDRRTRKSVNCLQMPASRKTRSVPAWSPMKALARPITGITDKE
jgi:hypothetical protein